MSVGIDKQLEMADEIAERQVDASIEAAREALRTGGEPECIECGEVISLDRRRAMPSATRCLMCQQVREHDLRSRQ